MASFALSSLAKPAPTRPGLQECPHDIFILFALNLGPYTSGCLISTFSSGASFRSSGLSGVQSAAFHRRREQKSRAPKVVRNGLGHKTKPTGGSKPWSVVPVVRTPRLVPALSLTRCVALARP